MYRDDSVEPDDLGGSMLSPLTIAERKGRTDMRSMTYMNILDAHEKPGITGCPSEVINNKMVNLEKLLKDKVETVVVQFKLGAIWMEQIALAAMDSRRNGHNPQRAVLSGMDTLVSWIEFCSVRETQRRFNKRDC